MSSLCSTRVTFAALTVAAGMHATIPAFAQNINDLLTIFGGEKQRAARQAQVEWRRLPPAEMACIDQRLRRKGSSVEALVRSGVKPSAGRRSRGQSDDFSGRETTPLGLGSLPRGLRPIAAKYRK